MEPDFRILFTSRYTDDLEETEARKADFCICYDTFYIAVSQTVVSVQLQVRQSLFTVMRPQYKSIKKETNLKK